MRTLKLAAGLIAAALASTSASGQATSQTGQATGTQERSSGQGDNDMVWNLIGALGLIGLAGLWRPSDNDGYTDDPI